MLQLVKGHWWMISTYQVQSLLFSLPRLRAVMSCPNAFAIKLIKFPQYKITSCSPSTNLHLLLTAGQENNRRCQLFILFLRSSTL